jgi:hypothetical protein
VVVGVNYYKLHIDYSALSGLRSILALKGRHLIKKGIALRIRVKSQKP